MDEPLARFRELRGVGRATEARLHEAGVYSWRALADVLGALGRVHGVGEALRELTELTGHRTGNPDDGSGLPDGERSEAFILRLAVVGGVPRRCTATHVRSQAEGVWPGWPPREVARFVEEHAGLADGTVDAGAGALPPGPPSIRTLVLDAGKAIGGLVRDIALVVGTDRWGEAGEVEYTATLTGRPLGGDVGGAWSSAARSGRLRLPERLRLQYPAVPIPPGVQRIRVQLVVRLPDALAGSELAEPPVEFAASRREG